MRIPKPGDDVVELFRSLIPDAPGVLVKPMFGNLGAFVNGNMFAGLYGDAIGVKLLSQDARDELSAIEGTGPYGPEERPMGGYLSLPAAWVGPGATDSDRSQLRAWIERSLGEVAALPEKKPKPRR